MLWCAVFMTWRGLIGGEERHPWPTSSEPRVHSDDPLVAREINPSKCFQCWPQQWHWNNNHIPCRIRWYILSPKDEHRLIDVINLFHSVFKFNFNLLKFIILSFNNSSVYEILYYGVQVGRMGYVPAYGGNGNSRNVSCSKPSLHCRKLYKWLTRSASDAIHMALYKWSTFTFTY